MVEDEEKEKISAKRWIVTYTKHMKQKRKVYQDGVLELCSSTGKLQVLLYDDCEKVIDRRFLKKDEIVESGGTLSIETHIVDIGDPDGNKKTSVKSNVTSVIRPESQKEKLCVEWNVLYTTHLTQKAKKYHDGILRVLICSSHLNLITLLNEDGAILSSKYLKSVACLETGKNCEFPNYLVEICERRATASGQGEEGHGNVLSLCKDLHKKGSTKQVCHSKPGKCDKLVTPGKDCKIPLCSVPKKETSGWRNSNATASAATSNLPKNHSKKVTNNCNSKIDSVSNSSTATLRDAWQILSVLKKPSSEGSIAIWDPFVEQGFTSQSSDRCQLDLQMSSEKTQTSAWHGSKSSNSQKDSKSAAHLVLDDDCEVISSEDDRALSTLSSGTVALDTTPTNCIVNQTVAHTGVTTKISEALGDPMLPGSSRTNKQDKPISDIGISREVIHNMKPIVPLQNSSGALNEEQHLPASGSLLKDNLDAKERSILHGMDTCLSSDSTPDQLCAKASQIGETASRVNATSDVTKEPVIPTSVELVYVEDFPTFDLGL